MPTPAAPTPAPTPTNRARSARVITLVVVLAIGAFATSCGDDARSATSAYRVVTEPCQGRLAGRATAAAIGPELLATVAHGVEGAATVELRRADGEPVAAEIVYLDPAKDIALLRPARALPDHLEVAEPEGTGPAAVLRLDDDDVALVDEAEILELVDATLDGEGRRAAARLAATIGAGDSGAAVVDDDGRMVAMVFATARGRDVGWAVAGSELVGAIATLDSNGPGALPPPAC